MEFAKRKHPRLKSFDYSQNGCYFVTLCTENKQPSLSCVGRGLAPADHTAIQLSPIGQIVEQELLALPNRYPFVIVDKYVIMPTHLHAIIHLEGNTANALPRGTLMDIICTLKSLTTRIYNQGNHLIGHKIWQTSFFEKVIRNEKSYAAVWEYIEANPLKWEEDEYYSAFS